MLYKNTKTGAIIDSPFLVTGEHWVNCESDEQIENTQISNDNIEDKTDVDDEPINLRNLSKEQLIEFAVNEGIEINTKAGESVILQTIIDFLEANEKVD